MRYALSFKNRVVGYLTLALAYQKKGLGDKAAEHFRIAEDLKRKAESANK
jgi:Tfp pilus assembly protein PilF